MNRIPSDVRSTGALEQPSRSDPSVGFASDLYQNNSQDHHIPLQRPLTAPTIHNELSLSQIIPPRRELPFKRTSTVQHAKEASDSLRLARSAVDLPPLPKPTLVEDTASNRHTSTAYHSTYYQPGGTPSGTANPSIREGISLPLSTATAEQQVHAKPGSKTTRLDSPLQETCAPNVTSYPTTSLFEQAQPASTPVFANHPADAGTDDTHTRPDQASSTNLRVAVDRISAIFMQGGQFSGGKERANLKEYSSQTYEERQATLNDIFVSHIMDEDFLALCEDVESCWTRIVLGL